MKKILIVNQSANYLMVDIVKTFKSSEHYQDVAIMVGNPKNVEELKTIGVKVDSICSYNRSSIKTRFISWIKGTWQIVKKVRKYYKDYELFLVSNPPTIHLLPYFCKNRYSALVYDVYPDGIVAGKFVTQKNVIYKIWTKWAKRFYGGADFVYAISNGMAETLLKYCNRKKIEVVPLWSNYAIHQVPKSDNQFVKENGLEEKFVVLYSGNMGAGSNISVLVDVAIRMKKYTDVLFLLIGDGLLKNEIEAIVRKECLNNVKLLPFLPFGRLSESLSSADVGVVSVSSEAAKVCVPSKTFNLLAVGAPLLCFADKDSEISRMIDDYGIGKSFLKTDVAMIEEFILSIKNDKKVSDYYVNNVRKTSPLFTSSNAEKFIK